MIERFEVGKSYRWIGPKKPSEWGIPDDMSMIWESRMPHKLNKKRNSVYRFTGIKSKEYPRLMWAYGGFESNFEEVTE